LRMKFTAAVALGATAVQGFSSAGAAAPRWAPGLDVSGLTGNGIGWYPTQDRGCDALTEQTRAVVVDFMNTAWWGYPKDVAFAVSKHYNDNMIQHEAATDNLKQGFVDGVTGYINAFGAQANSLSVQPIHVIVEGDFAITHSRYGTRDGYFSDNCDIFRLENGKIAEEWDVYNWDQIVPEAERANKNTYFGSAPISATAPCSYSDKAKSIAQGFMDATFYSGSGASKIAAYQAAADKYYAPMYIEHNPYTPNDNGAEDFKATMEFVLPANPNMKWVPLKAIADGNYVAFISRVWYDSTDGGLGTMILDVYRIDPETDRIAEHWDIDMDIPALADSASGNGVWNDEF